MLYGDLARVGDFRRGTSMRCTAGAASPTVPARIRAIPVTDGRQYNFTRSAAGKTVNMHLGPGPELNKVRAEVDHHREFVTIFQRIVDVNEAICDARPVPPLAAEASLSSSVGEKGGSKPSSPPR